MVFKNLRPGLNLMRDLVQAVTSQAGCVKSLTQLPNTESDMRLLALACDADGRDLDIGLTERIRLDLRARLNFPLPCLMVKVWFVLDGVARLGCQALLCDVVDFQESLLG